MRPLAGAPGSGGDTRGQVPDSKCRPAHCTGAGREAAGPDVAVEKRAESEATQDSVR